MFVVRADCADWKRVGDAHRQLLREAALVVDEFPLHRPVAVVRAERENPLARIASSPRGRAKIYYPRKAPYGLIEPAPLFEWVLHLPGVGVRAMSASSGPVKDERVILIHRKGGFEWAASASPDMAHFAEAVRKQGFPVQIIRGQSVDSWP
jgi:hypothetical protein